MAAWLVNMMTSHPPLMIRISKLATSGLLVASLLFAASLQAADITWTGEVNGQWTEDRNWNVGVPTSSDNALIQTGTVYLNATAAARSLNVASTVGVSATLFIQDGASLSVGSAAPSLIGTGNGATGIVTQTGGFATFANALTLGGSGSTAGGNGSWTISGGSLTVTGSSGLRLSGNTGGTASTSQFTQSGGTVALTNLTVGAARYGAIGSSNNATYTISGGDLSISGNFTHGTSGTGGSAAVAATTEVIGSSATINVGGNLTLNNNSRNTSTLSYAIDDGGVSTINVTGNATLAGTLGAGLKGGLTLTRTNEFTLVNAGGTLTSDFATGPDSSLWTTTTASGALKLTLASSARKATLAAVDNTTVGTGAFAAATTGFVEITGLTTGQELTLYLNADAGTGKTIDDLAAWFTDNGVAATALAGMDGYNLSISKTAADSTAWLAWDLSAFNADATLSAIGLATAAVPEPAAWTAIAALALLACVVARRLKGATTSG
ncbi:hypothetical protein OpiT1DRAFT_05846 [Opitutaceae bacterium TAV1]|nr:hypothetical protein OpiT1DRAFT_05846 [Opitutaceae bacterium TAV1]